MGDTGAKQWMMGDTGGRIGECDIDTIIENQQQSQIQFLNKIRIAVVVPVVGQLEPLAVEVPDVGTGGHLPQQKALEVHQLAVLPAAEGQHGHSVVAVGHVARGLAVHNNGVSGTAVQHAQVLDQKLAQQQAVLSRQHLLEVSALRVDDLRDGPRQPFLQPGKHDNLEMLRHLLHEAQSVRPQSDVAFILAVDHLEVVFLLSLQIPAQQSVLEFKQQRLFGVVLGTALEVHFAVLEFEDGRQRQGKDASHGKHGVLEVLLGAWIGASQAIDQGADVVILGPFGVGGGHFEKGMGVEVEGALVFLVAGKEPELVDAEQVVG